MNSRALDISVAITRLNKTAQAKHFTYELGTYNGVKTRVKCKCEVCGCEWETRALKLIKENPTGCPKCRYKIVAEKKRHSFDTIKQKLDRATDGGKFIYELTKYENNRQRIKCKCNTCGYEWETSIAKLIKPNPTGCRRCAMARVISYKRHSLTEAKQKLTEASQGRYTFELSEYHNYNQKIKCKCNKCSYEWDSSFLSLVSQKTGCPKCAGHLKISESLAYDELLLKSDGKYSFELPQGYKNHRSRVVCKCNKCGETWEAGYDKLVWKGTGCPNQCYKTQSSKSTQEFEIADYIKQNFPQLEVQQSVRHLIRNISGRHFMEIDIYIPQLNLAFEFNGTYWHSDKMVKKHKKGFITAQQYHDYKTQQCALKGVKLVHIAEQNYIDNKQNVLDFILKICCYRAVALNIDIARFKKQVA